MAKTKLNDKQRDLLRRLRASGGSVTHANTILAEGEWSSAMTGLSLFCRGLIVSDGRRVTLTEAGRTAAEEE